MSRDFIEKYLLNNFIFSFNRLYYTAQRLILRRSVQMRAININDH
jgi:hypothetical protein